MILVTGGCGYIGSHCVISLLNQNKKVAVIDNFVNSDKSVLKKINLISKKNILFYKGDLRQKSFLSDVFNKHNFETVFHFAGLKSLSESYKNPLEYFSANINSTINLLQTMQKYKVYNLIFSSSATVYGQDHPLPWTEDIKLKFPESPYAQSKAFIENLLLKYYQSDMNFKIGILRYFNPIGCHSSGLIGDRIDGSTNLIPSIMLYLLGKKPYLPIYGNDYKTKDGSGIRDYIHVDDLVNGHIGALKYIIEKKGIHIWNLGSGKGYSVFQIVSKFEEHYKKRIFKKVMPRREGDLSEYWADISKAGKELNWSPSLDIDKMILDSLNHLKKLKEANL